LTYIGHGFDYIEGVGGWGCVEEKVGEVSAHARKCMKELKHVGGESEVGPIVCFNLRTGDGAWIGHTEVGKFLWMFL
jgi:hypothetical protein